MLSHLRDNLLSLLVNQVERGRIVLFQRGGQSSYRLRRQGHICGQLTDIKFRLVIFKLSNNEISFDCVSLSPLRQIASKEGSLARVPPLPFLQGGNCLEFYIIVASSIRYALWDSA
jgi:hypothetical protein